jgi:uncharacterized membrane protein YkvA (DUF1232 family)
VTGAAGRVARWGAALRVRTEALEREVHALALAYRDARTPWYARAWAAFVVAYAVSPIDLIPDFVPILGYLDDLLLVPAGIWLALRLVPPEVLADARRRAAERPPRPGLRRLGLVVVGVMWLALLAPAAAAVVKALAVAR